MTKGEAKEEPLDDSSVISVRIYPYWKHNDHKDSDEEELPVVDEEKGKRGAVNDNNKEMSTRIDVEGTGRKTDAVNNGEMNIINSGTSRSNSNVHSSERTRQQKPHPLDHRKQLICCPISRKPLQDPVVFHRDGISYEREALIAHEGHGSSHGYYYYSNRALKDYLDPSTNPRNELLSSCEDKKGIFFCPISCDLFRDPVIDPEGNTFERGAIAEWIREHGAISPITRNPLLNLSQLYDNTTLFRVLYREVQNAGEKVSNTEEIKAWKKDVASFDYLTNSVKPVGINDEAQSIHARQELPHHPARTRVDANGRWRNRNRNAGVLVGVLLSILLTGIVLIMVIPKIALVVLGALLVTGLVFGFFKKIVCASDDG